MDYSVSVSFNGNLVANEYCEITYFGSLFKNNSDSITIVYGFDNDWKYTDSKEMIKTDNGFVTKIKMLDYSSFNFCFRNSNYEWDNNYSQNYTSPITKESKEEKNTEAENITENLENENVIDVETVENCEDEGLEAENIVIEEPTIDSFDATIEKDEPINIEETLVNSFEEANLTSDIENIFGDIYVSPNESSIVEQTAAEMMESSANDFLDSKFNMNSLIDEILSPITSSSVFEEEKNNTIVEEKVETQFADSTQDIENDAKIDNMIDGLITDLYNNVDTPNTENIIEVQEENEDVPEIVVEPAIIKKAVKIPDFVVLEDDEEETQEQNDGNTEDSLLENINENPVTTENIVEADDDQTSLTVSNRTLSKFYMIRKKIKLALMKLFRFLPKGSSSEDAN